MTVNVAGIISVVLFYILILAVGIWAGRKSGKRTGEEGEADEVMLAGRNIGTYLHFILCLLSLLISLVLSSSLLFIMQRRIEEFIRERWTSELYA